MCTTCGCNHNDGVTITRVGSTFMPYDQPTLLTPSPPANHEQNDSDKKIIKLEQDILSKNSLEAAHNRYHFQLSGITAINFVSSPGSGKTTLLERTLNDLKAESEFYVIEGDQQTMNDANRIAATGCAVVQINTGKGCHLDARMIHRAVHQLNPAPHSFVFIENVGNLVCPALFDLGEEARVAIISVTEGDDKPIKYPDIFESSDLCIINKADLLPYVNFSVATARKYALQVNPALKFIVLSATTGEGLDEWYTWLREQKAIVNSNTANDLSQPAKP